MRKVIGLFIVAFLLSSVNSFSQEKKDKSTQKATTEQTKKKDADKSGTVDKVVAGQKGPNGEKVYEGPKGGQYYMNKNGNKVYLKDEDKSVAGKKGPNGETVYEGPKGGQYYLNKNGEKVYLKAEKK